jgi:WD40 repeat protein
MLAPPAKAVDPDTRAVDNPKRAFPRPFGSYELIEEIARGGMGIVYKARQVALNRFVALKVIVAGQLSSPDFVKRFRTEAEAAAALDHPNIVPIYEISEFDGQPFFSMRLIDGPTLREHVGKVQSAQAQQRVAGLAAKLARAVHYAHQRGIIHRDLKPGNVLLDAHGEPHLTDFGLAKLVEKDSTITKTMAVLGTPSYMAPEQARGETKSLTTAADIYSLGAVLYELLTGQPPFAGGTTMETIRQVLEKDPRPPTSLNPKIDRDLETVCLKCLEKEASSRYGSAEALADELDRWLRHEPIAARPASRWHRLAKWARRHPAVAILLGGLLVSLTLGFALTSWQSAARQRALVEARRFLYAARIGLVEQAWAAGHVNRGRVLLESLKPRAGQEDLRGFEWRYLWRICRDQSFFTLSNEQDSVDSVATSPNGKWLALAGGRPSLVLWDVPSRQVVARLPTGSGCRSVAFSADGALLAAAGQDAAIRIWEAASQRELFLLRGHAHPVEQVAFSPDGKWLASVSRPDGMVKLWDLASRTAKMTLTNLPNEWPEVAFSPDSSILAWTGGNRTIRLTEVPTGIPRATLSGHGGSVTYLAFSPDGKWLASASKDLEVRLWDVESAAHAGTFVGHTAMVTSVAFSPDSQLLVTGCADGTLKLWSVPTRSVITTYKGHEMWVNNAVFLPDGHTIVSAGQDGYVKFWEVVTKGPSTTVEYHSATLNATSIEDSAQDGEISESFLRQDAGEVRFSADGSRLGILDDRPIIQVWDGEVRQSLGTRLLPNSTTMAVALFPNGRQAVSAGTDRKLRLWNLNTAEDPIVLAEMEYPAGRLAISPNGQRLATGTLDGHILEWDTASWKPVATNFCGPGQVTALKFSPDLHALLAAIKISEGTNFLVKVDLASHALRLSPEHHKGTVTALALSPDGKRVAGSSRDSIVRLWETQFLARVGTFRGHSGYVISAAFSPDGRTLATASNDGTVKLWEVASRQELFTLPGNIAPWTQLAFSPDGNELVGCGEAGLIRVWRAATGNEVR